MRDKQETEKDDVERSKVKEKKKRNTLPQLILLAFKFKNWKQHPRQKHKKDIKEF